MAANEQVEGGLEPCSGVLAAGRGTSTAARHRRHRDVGRHLPGDRCRRLPTYCSRADAHSECRRR